MIRNILEPTADQCSNREKVYEGEHKVAYAIWFPQIGGYAAKAVAVLDECWTEEESSRSGGCIDLLVWHDGDFPSGTAREFHICDAKQFVTFGQQLEELNLLGKNNVPKH